MININLEIPGPAVTFAVPKFKQVPNAYYTTIS